MAAHDRCKLTCFNHDRGINGTGSAVYAKKMRNRQQDLLRALSEKNREKEAREQRECERLRKRQNLLRDRLLQKPPFPSGEVLASLPAREAKNGDESVPAAPVSAAANSLPATLCQARSSQGLCELRARSLSADGKPAHRRGALIDSKSSREAKERRGSSASRSLEQRHLNKDSKERDELSRMWHDQSANLKARSRSSGPSLHHCPTKKALGPVKLAREPATLVEQKHDETQSPSKQQDVMSGPASIGSSNGTIDRSQTHDHDADMQHPCDAIHGTADP